MFMSCKLRIIFLKFLTSGMLDLLTLNTENETLITPAQGKCTSTLLFFAMSICFQVGYQ